MHSVYSLHLSTHILTDKKTMWIYCMSKKVNTNQKHHVIPKLLTLSPVELWFGCGEINTLSWKHMLWLKASKKKTYVIRRAKLIIFSHTTSYLQCLPLKGLQAWLEMRSKIQEHLAWIQELCPLPLPLPLAWMVYSRNLKDQTEVMQVQL